MKVTVFYIIMSSYLKFSLYILVKHALYIRYQNLAHLKSLLEWMYTSLCVVACRGGCWVVYLNVFGCV